MTHTSKLREFHAALGDTVDRRPQIGAINGERESLEDAKAILEAVALNLYQDNKDHGSMHLVRAQLLISEVAEVVEAILEGNIVDLLGEMIDCQYVIAGTLVMYGLDGIADEAFVKVHASNMTKMPPSFDAGGRLLKGPGYVKHDLTGLVQEEVDRHDS